MHRFLSGSGEAPEEWVVMKLCRTYGSQPEPGGMFDQPLGLVTLGTRLLEYEEAYATYVSCERAKQPVPPDVLRLIASVQAMSARERMA